MSELTCQELVELVTDYLDGALSDVDRRRFDEHLDDCSACAAYVAQFATVIELTGTLVAANVSADARDALLAQFRSWKSGA
jgi:anti-sigma factor RsiW